ncbi:MAG TPA: hypothetical protein VFZ66_22935 [Herpetosiphonaceae bacterium]
MTTRTERMPQANVQRAGGVEQIPARDLAPGDIIVLQDGDWVPADCRLIECVNLRIQEAALTGESEPVDKVASTVDEAGTPVCEDRCMAFMGTVVVAGHGRAIVTATGAHTAWGRLAALSHALPPGRRQG